jgi:hypothetical protein
VLPSAATDASTSSVDGLEPTTEHSPSGANTRAAGSSGAESLGEFDSLEQPTLGQKGEVVVEVASPKRMEGAAVPIG